MHQITELGGKRVRKGTPNRGDRNKVCFSMLCLLAPLPIYVIRACIVSTGNIFDLNMLKPLAEY